MSFIFVAAMVESSKGLSSQELTIFYFCLPIIHTVLDVFLERYVYFKSIIERYQVFLSNWRIDVNNNSLEWYKWDIQVLQSSIKVQYIDLKNKHMSWYMNEKLGTFARKNECFWFCMPKFNQTLLFPYVSKYVLSFFSRFTNKVV